MQRQSDGSTAACVTPSVHQRGLIKVPCMVVPVLNRLTMANRLLQEYPVDTDVESIGQPILYAQFNSIHSSSLYLQIGLLPISIRATQ
jgi:hypothetical protein